MKRDADEKKFPKGKGAPEKEIDPKGEASKISGQEEIEVPFSRCRGKSHNM